MFFFINFSKISQKHRRLTLAVRKKSYLLPSGTYSTGNMQKGFLSYRLHDHGEFHCTPIIINKVFFRRKRASDRAE